MSFTKTRWTGLGFATWLLVVLLTGVVCGALAGRWAREKSEKEEAVVKGG